VPGDDAQHLVLQPQPPGWGDVLDALGTKSVPAQPPCPEAKPRQLHGDFGFIAIAPDEVFAVQIPSGPCGYYGGSISRALESTGQFESTLGPL
jgi:hypothetical protein